MASSISGSINKKNIQNAYERLKNIVSSDNFLSNKGLNNEVPFHLCPYDANIQNEVNQLIKQLSKKLNDAGIRVLEINLYELVITILQAEGDWEWLLDNESTMTRDELKEELQGILDMESVIIPSICGRMETEEFEVLFLYSI